MPFDMDFSLPDSALLVQGIARDLAQDQFRVRAAEVDQSEEYPWDNVKALVSHGLMGRTISTDYGGSGGALQ